MIQEGGNGVIYISGLSASGKTTLAYRLVNRFNNINKQAFLMDGTEMYNQSILYPFDGRTLVDRESRSSHSVRIANWISIQGLIPIVAVIGQPLTIREEWKKTFNNFNEIYLNCKIETCIQRDNKNLYTGNKSSIIGVKNNYGPPVDPWLEIVTDKYTPRKVEQIAWDKIKSLKWIK
jgi:adenylylsulfate kinase-like enzyme